MRKDEVRRLPAGNESEGLHSTLSRARSIRSRFGCSSMLASSWGRRGTSLCQKTGAGALASAPYCSKILTISTSPLLRRAISVEGRDRSLLSREPLYRNMEGPLPNIVLCLKIRPCIQQQPDAGDAAGVDGAVEWCDLEKVALYLKVWTRFKEQT
mmetsp:Transcript_41975/g.132320  ORF Transcript_41975/g.132320 Transcript_41975/m.132320 type:complete len:155 (-) Transcript_41975:241-705(-)